MHYFKDCRVKHSGVQTGIIWLSHRGPPPLHRATAPARSESSWPLNPQLPGVWSLGSWLHLFLSVPGPGTRVGRRETQGGRERGGRGPPSERAAVGGGLSSLPLILPKGRAAAPAAPAQGSVPTARPSQGPRCRVATGPAAEDTPPGPSPATPLQTLPHPPLCVCASRGDRRRGQRGPHRQPWGWAELPFGPKLVQDGTGAGPQVQLRTQQPVCIPRAVFGVGVIGTLLRAWPL